MSLFAPVRAPQVTPVIVDNCFDDHQVGRCVHASATFPMPAPPAACGECATSVTRMAVTIHMK
jgi:hypothetical protein